MSKKGISILTITSMMAAFLAVLSCHCVGGDCQSVPGTVQAVASQCHHAETPAAAKNGATKECCGKCRIEKAAIPSKALLTFNVTREHAPGTAIGPASDLDGGSLRAVLPALEFSGSPPGFFTRYIVNVTFSFRAPPQG